MENFMAVLRGGGGGGGGGGEIVFRARGEARPPRV